MIQKERNLQILKILKERGVISIKTLCNELFTSKSTIRRDLIDLEKQNLVVRTRGGVCLIKKEITEFSGNIRANINKIEKNNIADIAKNFIKDDMTLFLDSSSTVNALTKHLMPFRNLRIITNGLNTALSLVELKNVTTYVCAGKLKGMSYSIINDATNNYIDHFNADIAFLSCKYLDENFIYEADPEQATPKQYMIKNAKKTIILADHTKLNRKSFYKISDISNINTVITDEKANKDFLNLLRCNTNVIYNINQI